MKETKVEEAVQACAPVHAVLYHKGRIGEQAVLTERQTRHGHHSGFGG